MSSNALFSSRGNALIGQQMFKVLEDARRLEQQGERIYHLELGNPRLNPPEGALERTIESLRRHEVGYTYSSGVPALRQGIANLYQESLQITLAERNVVISPANLIINQFLDIVCNPGDKIVFFTPAFPTYWAAATHIGLPVCSVPLAHETGYALTEQAIAEAMAHQPRAIIVNSANNPTGAVYSKEMLDLLVQECIKRDIWLLSDETYGDISFGRTFYSLAPYVAQDALRVVVMSSFSKIFSVPGYRTGYLLAHPQVADKFALSVSTLISCLPIFTQLGCVEALQTFGSYTANVRHRCANISQWCTEMLRTSKALSFTPPDAGFYFFIDISASGLDDFTFAERLLNEQHTAVIPGSSFGDAYTSHIRIATCGLEDDVRAGVQRILSFVAG
jgi:aspartate/methionine/tyrosine aminotransferase